ncbi:SusC/RagA family TonB-linked outer membrane protein [Maribacter sp. 2210JD10-5]|uniref:SusC/RagA family TonB-linked outer membrane protein n=1 Tax=Maribacter sp. 2210JD10-5 TaxID=3386272 RepID=UPI0039BD9329
MKKLTEGTIACLYVLFNPSLKMRITYFLFLASLLQVHASAYSQGKKISLELENVALETVFDQIEELTDFRFLYNNDYVNLSRKVSISADEQQLKSVLRKVFKGTDVDFIIVDKQVVLKLKSQKEDDGTTLTQSKPQREVNGIVFDEDGIPLAGVSVLIKDTQRGVATNFDGEFAIAAREGETLLFSYLGFLDFEVLVDDADFYEIEMISSALQLEGVELLSTGYQKISKERATGSFAQVDEEILDAKIEQNILSKIISEVPGLVTDANGSLIIRGLSSINPENTAPLIVIDGFPVETSISSINPNEVKSISVLKDAAAASIWGIRAANGVISIVTKNGNRNNKLQIEVSQNTAVTPKLDIFSSSLGSPATQLAYQSAVYENGGAFNTGNLFSGELDLNSFSPLNPIIETLLLQERGDISAEESQTRLAALENLDARREYAKFILRPTRWQQSNLAFSGGSENHDFRASATHNRNEGGTVADQDDQFIINFTNRLDITDKLKARASINFSESDIDFGPDETSDNIAPLSDRTGVVGFLSNIPINSRLVDDNGNYVPSVLGSSAQTSQLALNRGFAYPWTYNTKQEFDNANNNVQSTELRLQAGLDYEIIPALTASLSYQYEWSQDNARNLYNENTFATRNRVNLFTTLDESLNATANPIPRGSILDLGATTSRAETFRAQLNYDALYNEGLHQLTAIAGYEVRKTVLESNTDRKYGYDDQSLVSIRPDFTTPFPLPLSQEVDRQSLIPDNSTIGFIENRFLSYYANAAYTFDGRYTLSASTRLDDTNLFGASDKFRNIPLYSVGLKWNLGNEGFFDPETISSLQLRATYGINGNVDRNTSPFLQAAILRGDLPFNNIASFIRTVPNPELRLEKTRTLNLGIDFGFFNERISGSVEYYKKNSEDLLANRSFNPTLGIVGALSNIGKLTNEGVDANIALKLVDADVFNFTTSANFGLNTNTLTQVDVVNNSVFDFVNGQSNVVGNPLQSVYSFNFAGLDRNGAPQFLNENNEIVDFRTDITNVDALINEGTLVPRYYGSWINDIRYGNFALRVLTTFKAGHVFWYGDDFGGYFPSYVPSGFQSANVPEDFNARWQQRGDENTTDIPAFPNFSDSFAVGYENLKKSDKFYDSAAHIRLSQINLRYTFSQFLTKKLAMKSLQIGLQADNVAVWDFNRWNVDPENFFIGQQPTFTLNLNASF